MYVFTYKCDLCGFRATAVRGNIGFYRFADGYNMHALTEPAWCHVCNDITSVESLKPLDVIESEIDRLRQKDYNDWDIECAEMLHESVDAMATRRIELLRTQKSRFENRTIPNRCIECGFSDFRTLRSFATASDLPESFLHFQCGGLLRQIETCHASPATYFVLDCDGNRVPAGPCGE